MEELSLSSCNQKQSIYPNKKEIGFEKITQVIKNRVVEVNSQLLETQMKVEKDFLEFAEHLSFVDVSSLRYSCLFILPIEYDLCFLLGE